jgi:subtilase family serine protease
VLGPATGHSDLVVTAVTDPPADVLPSSTFTVTATVLNQGADPAGASTTSFYLVNPTTGTRKSLKGGQSIGALAPGESLSSGAALTLYSDTIPATYTLQACADGPKTLAEQNETNNCANAAQTITVLKVPNLLVNAMTNPPAVVTLGNSFKLTNSVRNVGTVSAGTTNTKYYLVSTVDGSRKDLQGTQIVPILNAGQTFSEQETLTVRPETLPGQYKVQACADGGKDVAESNEDDNCTTTTAVTKVVGPPDLTVISVLVKNAPLSVARGGTLTITAGVKNLGEGDAPPSTTKYMLVHTVTGATKNLNGTMDYGVIRPGTTSSLQRVVTVFADTPVGVYVVQASSDSLDVVVETSETNNCFTTSATITVQ